MGMRYTYSNPYYLGTQIKYVVKDMNRGALTREEAARRLRQLADKLEQLTPEMPELPFDELPARIAEHLGRNR